MGFIGLIRTDRVRIETLGQARMQRGPVLRGRRGVWRMLDYLDGIEAGETTSLAQGVKNFCVRNSGKGIVVLITDLMDKNGYEAALRYLVSQQMDVYVIQVLSQEELDPDVKGDLKLVDAKIRTSRKSRSGTATRQIQIDAERVRRRRAGVLQPPRDELLLANNQTPVKDLIGSYLRRRGLVR